MDSLTGYSASYLCSTCSTIFFRANEIVEEIYATNGSIKLPVGNPTYPHHRSLAELKQSAREKCYLCIRLWLQATPKAVNTVQSTYNPDQLADIRYTLTAKDPSNPNPINVWFMEGELNMIMPRFYGRYTVMPNKC